jgi:hypothetical protein
MNRNFIFVLFVLLATLSIVNAIQLHKRTTKFGPCPVDPSVTTLSATLNPDPVVSGQKDTVTISGTLNVDVPAGSKDTLGQVAFLDPDYIPIVDPTSVIFCEAKGITCPFKAGTAFNITVDTTVPDLGQGATIAAAVVAGPDQDFLGCALSDPVS